MGIAPSIANGVSIEIMLTAIDLNYKSLAKADEVEDAAVTGHLPAEMIAA